MGIINDQNPTAFTYGSLPNSARLVVSQGLFTYLDDDEIATVYAHELGHIVHWDFAVMTAASTLVQICYLIYSTASRFSRGGGDSKIKNAIQTAALVAYIFYIIGTYNCCPSCLYILYYRHLPNAVSFSYQRILC